MSATLTPPPPPDASVVATTISTPLRASRATAGEPFLPVAVARLIAFTALAAWGAQHWMMMLEPAESGRGWTILLVGLFAAALMLGAGRLPTQRARTLAAVAALVPIFAAVLLAGRVADELLLPGGWSELAGGISRGISDLPGVRVPYRGLDDWVRTVFRSAAARSSRWPRCWRSGRGGPSSGSRSSRCSR